MSGVVVAPALAHPKLGRDGRPADEAKGRRIQVSLPVGESLAGSVECGSRAGETGRRPHRLNLVIGAVFITCGFSWVQFATPSVCCADFDGYYHIKWSALLWDGMRHGDFLPAFTWLPLTTLSPARYADQHFLYHLLLIPFTWFGDLRLGAKVATTLFGSAAILALYGLILRYRIRYPLAWLLALLGCSWFFYARLNMTKATGLSLLYLALGVYLLFERKYAWLGPVAFLYAWTYNLFVILAVLAFIWLVVVGWSERRLEWRPLLWTIAGILAAFVIHPYFPKNVSLFLEHLLAKSGQLSIAPGGGFEWYSVTSWIFFQGSVVACAAMVAGYLTFGYALALSRHDRTCIQRPMLLLFFSTFLLLITIRSIRFMEYWPPFAVLFAAFALQAAWEAAPMPAAEVASPEATSLQDAPRRAPTQRPGRKEGAQLWRLLEIPLLMLLTAAALHALRTARTKVAVNTKPPDHYAAGADWLIRHVPAGALIYNANWSDFPKLFFYDTMHRYVSGLDPLYLLDAHPELARLNDRLSRAAEPDPTEAIRSLFAKLEPAGVNYLFIGDAPSRPSPQWLRYAFEAGFREAYEDQDCLILRISDSPAKDDSPGQ